VTTPEVKEWLCIRDWIDTASQISKHERLLCCIVWDAEQAPWNFQNSFHMCHRTCHLRNRYNLDQPIAHTSNSKAETYRRAKGWICVELTISCIRPSISTFIRGVEYEQPVNERL
jgi:hypothetical protein